MDPLLCPGCGHTLENARPVEGPRLPSLAENESALTCGACLAIVAIFEERVGEEELWKPAAKIHVGGGVMARALERLRDADAQGALRDAYDEIRSDPDRRVALRVPEVFRVARRALATRAAVGRPFGFRVTRETRTSTSSSGGVSVEGFWAPAEREMDVDEAHPDAVVRFMTRPATEDEPDARQFPAMLQAWEGWVMLVAGAPLKILGEEGTRLRVQPVRSRWVRDGNLDVLRVPLDLLMADPEAP